jgi:ADP-ribosylation factor GTPase-activating protein 1
MDAFKQSEIERMRLGGNENWRNFFDEHEDTKMRGIGWDDATIAERYSGEVGEEWKERLSCKVEGKDYVASEKKTSTSAPSAAANPAVRNVSRTATPLSGSAGGGSRTASPSRKAKVDDKYFAKLGADNASRPEHVPPSQGGKYAGFGNTPMPTKSNDTALPSVDELQKDPMAALTKGFGWFTSTVTKTAKTVNSDYIQPTASKVCVDPISPNVLYDHLNLAPVCLSFLSHAITYYMIQN